MKLLNKIAFAASLSVITFGAMSQTSGTTVIDSLSIDSGAWLSVTSTEWRGPIFMTGTSNYSINELSFQLSDAAGDTVQVSLYALDSVTNLPTGSVLASTTFTGVDGLNTINDTQLGALASAILASGRKYALILSAASGDFGLNDNDDVINAFTFAEGFSAAGDGYVQTANSGTTWSDSSYTPIFQLKVALANLINAIATRQSMVENAVGLRKVFALQASSVNPGLSLDCSVFDDKGVCVAFTGKYTSVGGSAVDAASGALTVAYKFNPQVRVGGYIEQRLGDIVDQGVRIDNNRPDFGIFGVWSEREDGQGLQVRAAYRQGKKDLTVTRADVTGAEIGSGSSQLQTQGVQLTVSRGYLLNNTWMATPYLGIRDIRIMRDGYTETNAVTTPLTYAKLTQKATQLLLGANFAGKLAPKITLLGSIGLEHDLKHSISDYSATGVTGLQAIQFDTNPTKTRPVVSAGVVYAMNKAKQVSAQVVYRKEAFSNSPTSTAQVTFSMGF